MPLVSVLVPVYCNAASLPLLHHRLGAVARSQPDCTFEFIFVDDGSFDNSYKVLLEMAAQDKRVRVIKLSRNFGSSTALMAGLAHAQGDCVAMIAADLQDPPELIGDMLGHWRSGVPVVLAARRRRADPLPTRIPAAIFNTLFRRLVFQDFPKDGFDCALIDRRVVNVLVSCAEKNAYVFGLIVWVGFKRQVIYYDRLERQHGRSMWTVTKKLKHFADAFVSFSYLPLRAASTLGFLLATVGGLYALVVVLARILAAVPVQGWSSLMIILLLTSGVQLVMLGVIGEYVWRGLDQARQRPLYVVEEIVGQPEQDGIEG